MDPTFGYDETAGSVYNYFRDYDAAIGRYVESDPVGLLGGLNTFAYVDSNPISFVDPDGLGKQGGQTSVGGDDPLMPRGINERTPREKVNEQIRKIKDFLERNPNVNPKRKKKLLGWIKVAQRGFTRSVCPPLLADLVLNVLRESCLRGDSLSCESYCSMGGECTVSPGNDGA